MNKKGITLKIDAKDKWEPKTLYQMYKIWKKLEKEYGSHYLEKYLSGYNLIPKPLEKMKDE